MLLLLLMLVLPAQALATALVPGCLASMPAGHDQYDYMDHSSAHGDHHGTSMLADRDSVQDSGHLPCPFCSGTCHAAGALTSMNANARLVLPDAGPPPLFYVSFHGFVADIPKRPPRAHLA
jgi:hypothetical protein